MYRPIEGVDQASSDGTISLSSEWPDNNNLPNSENNNLVSLGNDSPSSEVHDSVSDPNYNRFSR